MECTAKLFYLALIAHLVRDVEGVATCCPSSPGRNSCTILELLCRAGLRNDSTLARQFVQLNNDAAVGILTLGKRKVSERRVQDRLQQMLHDSRNQAAGILTMGKRFEDARESVRAPPESLRQLKYSMPTVPEDLKKR
ncbi:hypothetical protein DNTS_035245 [Danionella cerebrum]|uniref:Hypocretin neuropeptide precursor n=1 Tax=Danionella cerebrum TaxID=2873325 RepID=A0A553N329_9TELE|nr:hypothetical protein DNTS_035245 [Danionella translucida]